MDSVVSKVPDVLVQHPTKQESYLIPGERLTEFAVGPETWSSFGSDVVTFVIADEADLLEEIPPVTREPGADLTLHIQDPVRESAYFLTSEQLAEFKAEGEIGDYDISFVVPVGLELIEEMPALMRGLLQSSERPTLRLRDGSAEAQAV